MVKIRQSCTALAVTWLGVMLWLPGSVLGVDALPDWSDPVAAIHYRCDREMANAYMLQPDEARLVATWQAYISCANRMLESHLNSAGDRLAPHLLTIGFPDHCTAYELANAREVERQVSAALVEFESVSQLKQTIRNHFYEELNSRGLLNRMPYSTGYGAMKALVDRLPLDPEESERYVQVLTGVRSAARQYQRDCAAGQGTAASVNCGEAGCEFRLKCEQGSEVVIDRGLQADECAIEALPLMRGNRVLVTRGKAAILLDGVSRGEFEISLDKGSDIQLGLVKRKQDRRVSEVDFSVERGRMQIQTDFPVQVSVTGTIDGQGALVTRVSPPREGRKFSQVSLHFSNGNSVLVDVGHGLVSVTGPMGSRIARSGEVVRFHDGTPWE